MKFTILLQPSYDGMADCAVIRSWKAIKKYNIQNYDFVIDCNLEETDDGFIKINDDFINTNEITNPYFIWKVYKIISSKNLGYTSISHTVEYIGEEKRDYQSGELYKRDYKEEN